MCLCTWFWISGISYANAHRFCDLRYSKLVTFCNSLKLVNVFFSEKFLFSSGSFQGTSQDHFELCFGHGVYFGHRDWGLDLAHTHASLLALDCSMKLTFQSSIGKVGFSQLIFLRLLLFGYPALIQSSPSWPLTLLRLTETPVPHSNIWHWNLALGHQKSADTSRVTWSLTLVNLCFLIIPAPTAGIPLFSYHCLVY